MDITLTIHVIITTDMTITIDTAFAITITKGLTITIDTTTCQIK